MLTWSFIYKCRTYNLLSEPKLFAQGHITAKRQNLDLKAGPFPSEAQAQCYAYRAERWYREGLKAWILGETTSVWMPALPLSGFVILGKLWTSLCLGFLICKMGATAISSPWACYKVEMSFKKQDALNVLYLVQRSHHWNRRPQKLSKAETRAKREVRTSRIGQASGPQTLGSYSSIRMGKASRNKGSELRLDLS